MYTNIPKPVGTAYTNVNKAASDFSIYGSAIYGTSKYGVTNNYTGIAKPTGTAYTNIPKPV